MALSHIVMHLVLCNAATRHKTQSGVPVHVVMLDKVHRHVADETVRVAAAGAADDTAEFDVPWGTYLAQASLHAGETACSDATFFSVLPNHNREVTLQLQRGHTAARMPVIINGDLPAEFAYAQPTLVVFGKDAKCNAPVADPLPLDISQQNDGEAYYVSVYPSAALMQNMPAIPALRLTDSSGGYHYLKLPNNFLGFSSGWPNQAQFDVQDKLIDFLAAKPEDTLLCIRGYETTTEVH